MANDAIVQHTLVLYKSKPALVSKGGDKIELHLPDGKHLKVRPKDVAILHPGPLHSLKELVPPEGDVETAWELLAGETTNLAELAELIYGDYSPASAWATWEQVAADLFFHGTPEQVFARTPEDVTRLQTARKAKLAEQQAWQDFLARVQANQILPEDERYLREVEALALEQQNSSRVLQALGQPATPENAHQLLLKLHHWEATRNPYPARFGLSPASPIDDGLTLPDEERVDLTHLETFAIDDTGSNDPDDAISLDGSRLWVHVADVAALISPDTRLDLEARARGANLYLPEGTILMLPAAATQILGLGLADVSPALSFGIDLDTTGGIEHLEIVPSWVRVQRFTYEAAEGQLTGPQLGKLHQLAQAAMQRRHAHGAITIDLPEVKVRLGANGQVVITPIPPLQSRDLVRESMLICGEALARFAQEQGIPFPYTSQTPPEETIPLKTMADMFAQRRLMTPSQRLSEPGPHAGLGLPLYTQATSPLRRYADLVAHQQLRAFLRNEPLLDSRDILTRIAEAETVGSRVRQVERLARRHWALIYLQQHPGWQGEGVIVDRRGSRALVLIPELDLESWFTLPEHYTLNSTVGLKLNGVNLPLLESYFQVN